MPDYRMRDAFNALAEGLLRAASAESSSRESKRKAKEDAIRLQLLIGSHDLDQKQFDLKEKMHRDEMSRALMERNLTMDSQLTATDREREKEDRLHQRELEKIEAREAAKAKYATPKIGQPGAIQEKAKKEFSSDVKEKRGKLIRDMRTALVKQMVESGKDISEAVAAVNSLGDDDVINTASTLTGLRELPKTEKRGVFGLPGTDWMVPDKTTMVPSDPNLAGILNKYNYYGSDRAEDSALAEILANWGQSDMLPAFDEGGVGESAGAGEGDAIDAEIYKLQEELFGK